LITILSLKGEIIEKFFNSNKIDISNLTKGVYLLIAQNNKDQEFIKKIIKL